MTKQPIIDPKLLEFDPTPRQAEYVRVSNELGSMRKAAVKLGVHKNAVQESVARLKAAAAARGYAPEGCCGRAWLRA